MNLTNKIAYLELRTKKNERVSSTFDHFAVSILYSTSTVILAPASKSRSESSNIASLLFSPSSAYPGAAEANGGEAESSGIIDDLRDPAHPPSSSDRAGGEEPRSSSPKPSDSDVTVGAAAVVSTTGAASGAIPKSYSFNDGAVASPALRAENNDNGPFG